MVFTYCHGAARENCEGLGRVNTLVLTCNTVAAANCASGGDTLHLHPALAGISCHSFSRVRSVVAETPLRGAHR